MSEGREESGSEGKPSEKGISVYGYPQCAYTRLVLRAIEMLDLDIELRDTLVDRSRQQELVEAVGRGTVPVLRIEAEDGRVEWLPESRDIVDYLVDRFAPERDRG